MQKHYLVLTTKQQQEHDNAERREVFRSVVLLVLLWPERMPNFGTHHRVNSAEGQTLQAHGPEAHVRGEPKRTGE